MSNLQIIEALCELVEQQSALIRNLAFKLDEIGCMSAYDRIVMECTQRSYSDLLGADEAPDYLSET